MGDHIYRMDYAEMLRAHAEKKADVTLACIELERRAAKDHMLVSVNANEQVRAVEKVGEVPNSATAGAVTVPVSMGVFIFSREVLLAALRADHDDQNSHHDFSEDVLPRLVRQKSVYAYRFGGEKGRVSPDRYWRDVNTLDEYYAANMDLLKPVPPLNLYQADWPLRTALAQYPPARTVSGASGGEGIAINSIVAPGVIISGGSVQESILCNNVFVDDESIVERSILFDGVRVGRGVRLSRCIVDKGVHIPDGERIGIDINQDRARFTVTESGVVAVPRLYKFG